MIVFLSISIPVEFSLAIHVKKRSTFSRLITFLLLSYGLIVTELMILLSSVTHLHSIRHIHVHIMNIFSESEVTENDVIPFHHLLIFVLGFTFLLFTIAFLLSQIFLHLLKRNLDTKSNSQTEAMVRSKNTWLPKKYRLIIYESEDLDAFSFTLVKIKRMRFHIQDTCSRVLSCFRI